MDKELLEIIFRALIPLLPVLFGWIAAIIVAAILIKRGMPSKLFLWGSILPLIGIIIGSIAVSSIYYNYTVSDIITTREIVTFDLVGVNTATSIIQLVGIILITIGFWKVANRWVRQ